MWTSAFACMYVCAFHGCCVRGGQKRAPGLFKLEFQLAVNYHVDAWNRAEVLLQSNKCS